MPGLLFSVLTPVFNPDPDVLDAAITSVLAQSYPSWQLCLVDDASTRSGVREVLERWAARDARVNVHFRATNGGIAAASNEALAMARGDFLALLDHDDLLHPDALAALNHVLVHDDAVDVVYTDEDKIDAAGTHSDTFYKPDWSPDYLTSCAYLAHLTAYRTRLVLEVGGFRLGYEGSQDWDLALRVTERARRIVHIRDVLYHWRISTESVSSGAAAKPYAADAGRRALQDHFERQQVPVTLEESSHAGWFYPRRQLAAEPLVSVLLPTGGAFKPGTGTEPELLVARCVRGLVTNTRYPNIEIICIISPGAPASLEAELAGIVAGRVPIRFRRTEGPFNFSATINLAATLAHGAQLLLLNDDTEALAPDWLDRMVESGTDPAIGAVGAKLLFANGRVQHAGVAHNRVGAPWHPGAGEEDGWGYFGMFLLPMNYLAVTGACLLTPAKVFWEVGGLDPALPLNYNDVDFCFKVGAAGYRIVQQNGAVLHHYESATRPPTVTYQEVNEFLERWGHLSRSDPFARPQVHEPL